MEGYRIPVDVITCDPNHYVRCARMLEAAATLPPEVREIVDLKQWSIRTPEGLMALKVFRVGVIPTLCINGRKCFENRVPAVDELYLALLQAAGTEEQRLTVLDAWSSANEEYAPARPPLPRALGRAA
jgi:hypothetical protein